MESKLKTLSKRADRLHRRAQWLQTEYDRLALRKDEIVAEADAIIARAIAERGENGEATPAEEARIQELCAEADALTIRSQQIAASAQLGSRQSEQVFHDLVRILCQP